MKKMTLAVWMLAITAVSISPTFAGHGRITPANLGKAHRLYNQGRRSIWVASTHQGARIVTNNPMAASTSARPKFYEVNIHGFANIYIDPEANYRHQGEHPIGDENHLLAAQRLVRSIHAKRARIVRNPNSGRPTRTAVIHPQMILLKPDILLRHGQPQPGNKKIEIPSVPAPPKKKPRLMALTRTNPFSS